MLDAAGSGDEMSSNRLGFLSGLLLGHGYCAEFGTSVSTSIKKPRTEHEPNFFGSVFGIFLIDFHYFSVRFRFSVFCTQGYLRASVHVFIGMS
jgi:hypothetical protein